MLPRCTSVSKHAAVTSCDLSLWCTAEQEVEQEEIDDISEGLSEYIYQSWLATVHQDYEDICVS